MTKFKVGDTVERILNAGDARYFSRQVGSGPYVVTSVSPTGKWLGINGWVDDNGDKEPWHVLNFTLLEQQDDPLPPAPESVRYYTVPSKTQYLDILPNEFGEVEIRSMLPDFASYNYLTPDAALQLAHDLNRMANEIKRKEKQNA